MAVLAVAILHEHHFLSRMQMPKFNPVILSLVVFVACSAKRPAKSVSASSMPTIATICETLDAYRDKQVELDGVFMGWRGGECRMPAHASQAVTRSDWLFKNGEDCIYVTGGRPQGFDPSDAKQQGRHLQLRAIVRLTQDQKAYLEFVSGKSLQ
jgi:hypothetical protein